MEIKIKRKLIEEALDQLKAAQQDTYVGSTQIVINDLETALRKPYTNNNFPTDNEIETAALDYRDKSDDENTDEDDNIKINWYDKQKAFEAGVKWLMGKLTTL